MDAAPPEKKPKPVALVTGDAPSSAAPVPTPTPTPMPVVTSTSLPVAASSATIVAEKAGEPSPSKSRSGSTGSTPAVTTKKAEVAPTGRNVPKETKEKEPVNVKAAAAESGDAKASKTKMLMDLAQDVAAVRRAIDKTSNDLDNVKTWIKDTLKPSLNNMRSELLGDVDGLKAIVSTQQQSFKNASQDIDNFRVIIQKESSEQVRFREAVYDKIAREIDLLSTSVDTRIKKETDRLWQMVEGWKKDQVIDTGVISAEDQMQLMETRLEQIIGREVRSNMDRVDQDMKLLEERLEQVCFREVIRLRAQLLAEKEAEKAISEGKPSSSISPSPLNATAKQQEVIEWLTEHGLEVYVSRFFEKGYDSMFVVQHIIIEDLDALGVTLPGHRKALLFAVEALGGAKVTSSTSTATAPASVFASAQASSSKSASYTPFPSTPASAPTSVSASSSLSSTTPSTTVSSSLPAVASPTKSTIKRTVAFSEQVEAFDAAPPLSPLESDGLKVAEVPVVEETSRARTSSGGFSKPSPPNKPSTPPKPAIASFTKARSLSNAEAEQSSTLSAKPSVTETARSVLIDDDDDEDLVPLPEPEPEPEVPTFIDTVAQDVEKLIPELRRISKQSADGQIFVPFQAIFRDNKIERMFDSVGGVLKAAKKKGLIAYEGELLLEGKHDHVQIFLMDGALTPDFAPPVESAPAPAPSSSLPSVPSASSAPSVVPTKPITTAPPPAAAAAATAPTKKPAASAAVINDAADAISRISAEDESITWALITFDKDNATVFATGRGGADELATYLDSSMVLFGYLRTWLGAEQRTKFVSIRWIGDNITPSQRAKAVEQTRMISESYFKFFHIEILAHHKDDVTTSLINSRLTKAAGANYDSRQNASDVNPEDFAFTQTKGSATQFFGEIEKQGNVKAVYTKGPLSVTPVDLSTRATTVGATAFKANIKS